MNEIVKCDSIRRTFRRRQHIAGPWTNNVVVHILHFELEKTVLNGFSIVMVLA